jgi:hypothetical protein
MLIDFEKVKKPVRRNLGYGHITLYPHKEDMERDTYAFDPHRTGYVYINSYANCISREEPKEVYLNYLDLYRLVIMYYEDEEFKEAIDKGRERSAITELIKLKSTGASLQTLKAIGKDYGLSEDIIEDIFKGEYV